LIGVPLPVRGATAGCGAGKFVSGGRSAVLPPFFAGVPPDDVVDVLLLLLELLEPQPAITSATSPTSAASHTAPRLDRLTSGMDVPLLLLPPLRGSLVVPQVSLLRPAVLPSGVILPV
jgi:hypothetical protein